MDTTHSTAACSKCKQCGRILTKDEIGLHKKLITAALPHIFALTAAANILRFPSHFFKKKIEEFKAMGCTLFL